MDFKIIEQHYLYDVKDLVISDESINFFHNNITGILNDKNRENTSVATLFYSILGYIVSRKTLEPTLVDAISQFVDECWTENGFVSAVKSSPVVNILKTKEIQGDVVPTYYCLMILELLSRLENERKDHIIQLLHKWYQPSGFFYNKNWSETSEDKRLDVELTMQTLFALKSLIFFGFDIPMKDEIVKQAKRYICQPRYITSLYHVVQMLLALKQEIKSYFNNGLVNFIVNHFDLEAGGFNEYVLDNVKVFSYGGMEKGEKGRTTRHRYGSDFVSPSINATTYALWMGLLAGGNFYNFLKDNRVAIKTYYDSQVSQNGGYGTAIKIAKYPVLFGPAVTANETLNYFVGRYLLQKLF